MTFMPVDAMRRSINGCLSCGSSALDRQTTISSPFLAERAWNGKPELTALLSCRYCGFRFFDRGLTDQEAANYYFGYRDKKYYLRRHVYEPFYTHTRWKTEGEWLCSDTRRKDLAAVLTQAGVGGEFESVLDYGGGTGHLLRGLRAERKAVYDLAGEETEAGVEVITNSNLLLPGWGLIVSAHVFEHLTDPARMMAEVARLLTQGGYLYMEVPNELWTNIALDSPIRDAWLRFIFDKPHIRLLVDIYSTAFRIKTGFLPPMGFVPVREHLNYFTMKSMHELAKRQGLSPKIFTLNSKGHYCMIASKEAATIPEEKLQRHY